MPVTLTSTGITYSDGSNSSTNGYLVIRNIFTSSTTWTCPAGVTRLTIYAYSGGGGQGNMYNTGVYLYNGYVMYSGGAGGRGGFCVATTPVTPSTVYTVTIGAGGASGGAGGETWFGVNSSTKIVSVTGGAAGTAGGVSSNSTGQSASGVSTVANGGTMQHNGDSFTSWRGGYPGGWLNPSIGGRTGTNGAGVAASTASSTAPGNWGAHQVGWVNNGVGGAIVLEYLQQ